MASMIPRVSRMEILFPVPFQPVFTRYAFAPLFSFFFTSSSPYLVGWSERNAAPKQAEKVGVGSVIPRSVPASFAVKPERKEYFVCSGVRIETGGRTPNASAERKITFFAAGALEIGLTIFSI